MKLLLATTNQGKIREIKEMLKDLPLEIVDLTSLDLDIEVEEDAPTFAGNAIKKVLEYGKKTKLLTLADDSGLEIEALGGYPGVESARIAKTEPESLKRILDKMRSKKNKKACFRCVIAIYNPKDDRIRLFDGKVEGEIAEKISQGEDGFHFDKIFFTKKLDKCFADATMEEKNKISSRGEAVRKAKKYLKTLTV